MRNHQRSYLILWGFRQLRRMFSFFILLPTFSQQPDTSLIAEDKSTQRTESKKMHILDFPVEIFHRVLFFAVLSRGVTRGLRLKLVCRAFRNALDPALFETRLLDSFRNPMFDRRMEILHGAKRFRHYYSAYRVPNDSFISPMIDWRIKNLHGAERFWHSYIAYRARNESDPSVHRYVRIRRVTEAFCARTGAQYESTLDAICWIALEDVHKLTGPCFIVRKPRLLCAAAHLGHMELAKELMERGTCPAAIFRAAIFLAAYAGNVDMLQFFRDHLRKLDDDTDIDEIDMQGMIGAMGCGDLDMLRLVYPAEFPHKFRPLLKYTRSLEVYQYIYERTGPLEAPERDMLLSTHAGHGNMEIVRQILGEDAGCQGFPNAYDDALTNVIIRYDEEALDLFLDLDAKPGSNWRLLKGKALSAAALCGSLAIMSKLLERGAKLHGRGAKFRHGYDNAVRNALLREHTAMLEFLLEKGNSTPALRAGWKELALARGLESMAELVQRFDKKPLGARSGGKRSRRA
ncbi:ankyrin [Hypoxylon sp. FL0543]|nr:ankyrin [Hypoxylon sp. FL0543]